MPEQSHGAVHHFGPASRLQDIKLRANAEVLELRVHVEPPLSESMRVTLTPAAHSAQAEATQLTIDSHIKKLHKKMETATAERLVDNTIKCSPIKFIDKFAFNEHSFLAKPSTTPGMAMARSGLQHVAIRRIQLLGLDADKEQLSDAILRVTPIYFEREFWAKSKHKLETYSELAHKALLDCVSEFHGKKAETRYNKIFNSVRKIAEESISDSFSIKS